MHKTLVLLRGAPGAATEPFTRAIREAVPERLRALDPTGLKLTLSRAPRPGRLSVIPFQTDPVALVSIWSAEAGAPWLDALRDLAPRAAAWTVEESYPVHYERHWPDDTPSPGVGLLCLFRRRPGLDDATFMHRWHHGHSSLSLEVHPLWHYIRNVVREPLAPDDEPWDGIVEEFFAEPPDLLHPHRFFGGPTAMLPNMVRVAMDIRRFMHLSSMQNHYVTEHFLRTPPGA